MNKNLTETTPGKERTQKTLKEVWEEGGVVNGPGLTQCQITWNCEPLPPSAPYPHLLSLTPRTGRNLKQNNTPNLPLFFSFFFFSFFFPGGENPCPGFPLFWSFVSVRLAKIKAQAAARVGRSGISEGCFTAPKERDWTYPPAA